MSLGGQLLLLCELFSRIFDPAARFGWRLDRNRCPIFLFVYRGRKRTIMYLIYTHVRLVAFHRTADSAAVLAFRRSIYTLLMTLRCFWSFHGDQACGRSR